MFSKAKNFNQDISWWDTRKLASAKKMFEGAINLRDEYMIKIE